MKRLYKRLLAIVLCLALMAAIVPATAFARDIPDGLELGDIVPGRVIVGLKQAYDGELSDMFPYLEIVAITDTVLSVIISSGKTPDEVNRSLREAIGTVFVIELSEETEEAVSKAIELLNKDDRVKYAEPDQIVGPDNFENEGDIFPGRVVFGLKEQYFGDATELFPDLSIERIEDMWLSVIMASPCYEKIGIPERLQQYIGTMFCIELTEKTEQAVYEAIDLLLVDPRVEYANPDTIVKPAVEPDITVADALAVLRVAARLAEPTLEMFRDNDKDGDGEITVNDALIVLRIAAKLA